MKGHTTMAIHHGRVECVADDTPDEVLYQEYLEAPDEVNGIKKPPYEFHLKREAEIGFTPFMRSKRDEPYEGAWDEYLSWEADCTEYENALFESQGGTFHKNDFSQFTGGQDTSSQQVLLQHEDGHVEELDPHKPLDDPQFVDYDEEEWEKFADSVEGLELMQLQDYINWYLDDYEDTPLMPIIEDNLRRLDKLREQGVITESRFRDYAAVVPRYDKHEVEKMLTDGVEAPEGSTIEEFYEMYDLLDKEN